ncbi:PIF1 [Mytilus edulis]|uniref:ATP-dependent DNA helicase n=1 Tax=Mytilus edulis TaxID=6550 RepID=A0A8S3SS11_MYTED|nr:PIF1 [Mytilus edulis]
MDEEQEQAFNLIVSGHNLLLTGQAGTGKSYVIKTAVKHLRSTGKTVALTCSIGIATSVFEDEHACTLHKWAGLEDGSQETTVSDQIHKSQGMSLQYLSIDCSNACFPGQIGVAVGRAKSTDGLMLKNFKPSLVKPHPDVVYGLYENSSVNVIHNDFSCCTSRKENTDENNNSDSGQLTKENSSNDTGEDTYNYFEEKKVPQNFLTWSQIF